MAANVALLDAAERVRTAYIEEHAEAARKVERKAHGIARRVAAGQTQLADLHATYARQLRALTADMTANPLKPTKER